MDKLASELGMGMCTNTIINILIYSYITILKYILQYFYVPLQGLTNVGRVGPSGLTC